MAPALGLTTAFPRSRRRTRKPRRMGWPGGTRCRLFGDVKYPADFKRFDYVNPDAPKGGVVRLFELGTFDNFNHRGRRREGIDRQRRRPDLSKR